jgi:hypothetical protein
MREVGLEVEGIADAGEQGVMVGPARGTGVKTSKKGGRREAG